MHIFVVYGRPRSTFMDAHVQRVWDAHVHRVWDAHVQRLWDAHVRRLGRPRRGAPTWAPHSNHRTVHSNHRTTHLNQPPANQTSQMFFITSPKILTHRIHSLVIIILNQTMTSPMVAWHFYFPCHIGFRDAYIRRLWMPTFNDYGTPTFNVYGTPTFVD